MNEVLTDEQIMSDMTSSPHKHVHKDETKYTRDDVVEKMVGTAVRAETERCAKVAEAYSMQLSDIPWHITQEIRGED